MLLSSPLRAEITIVNPELRESSDNFIVRAQFSYKLDKRVIGALQNGIQMTFIAEYQIEEVTPLLQFSPPFFHSNREILHGEHSFSLSYRQFNNRYYLISLDNNSHGTYSTIEEAVDRMRLRNDKLTIDKSILDRDKNYQVKIRASLDASSMPGLLKPYIYTPILWPEWKLDSGWHTIPIEALKK
ncbi:MAG: DUF4390 domain-containing protein [Thiotrichales bacterium]|jgi:hypothetical protein|nr:DUF4390 domain-containing protein [Thiotrichales bacterium]